MKNRDAFYYVLDIENRDKYSLVTKQMHEYTAADVAIIAATCANSKKTGTIQRCISNTRQKAQEFDKDCNEKGPLYQSVLGRLKFFKQYDMRK